MASSAIAPNSAPFLKKKELGLSALSSSSPFSVQRCKRKTLSWKICSVMAPQQSERKPATTGSVKTGMTMTEKILARASEKPQLSPGENVWVNVDILMTHDVCGPGSIGIFKKEFGQDAKVWDREKIVIIPDHYIFTSDERANRNVDILRDFCNEQIIKYFYDIKDLGNFKANPDYKGVCHVALAQEGHCRPGEVLLGTDSHTFTAGAFGQFATGIGTVAQASQGETTSMGHSARYATSGVRMPMEHKLTLEKSRAEFRSFNRDGLGVPYVALMDNSKRKYSCLKMEDHKDFGIPLFSGGYGEEDALGWIQEVEDFFRHVYVSSEKEAKLVARSLRDYASYWWNRL